MRPQYTRDGAIFLKEGDINNINLDTIISVLTECCDDNGGWCEDCPDIKVCVAKFDLRCNADYNPPKEEGDFP